MKVNRKNIYILRENEIIKFESEIVIFKIAFGMVHGQPYEKFQKHFQFELHIVRHYQ